MRGWDDECRRRKTTRALTSVVLVHFTRMSPPPDEDVPQRISVKQARLSGVRPLRPLVAKQRADEPLATQRSLKLIPPPNFGMVEDALYRSGQPSELSFPFLEKLRLKSIIWLAPEDPNPQLCVRR